MILKNGSLSPTSNISKHFNYFLYFYFSRSYYLKFPLHLHMFNDLWKEAVKGIVEKIVLFVEDPHGKLGFGRQGGVLYHD